jgi:hypothetical protein
MTLLPQRIFLGFVAGALSVLVFHQGMVSLIHGIGLAPQPPFRITPVPPFGVPLVVSLCFWGGLYGALFGAVISRIKVPFLIGGLVLGLLAVAVAWFVVAPLKGQAVAAGFQAWPMMRSLLVNLTWGLGTGLLLPLLTPRPLWRDAPG